MERIRQLHGPRAEAEGKMTAMCQDLDSDSTPNRHIHFTLCSSFLEGMETLSQVPRTQEHYEWEKAEIKRQGTGIISMSLGEKP